MNAVVRLFCFCGVALAVSCAKLPPPIKPIQGLSHPQAKPEISSVVSDVGTGTVKVDTSIRELQTKIGTLRETVRNSEDAVALATSEVELLQKKGAATSEELLQVMSSMREIKTRNEVLVARIEEAVLRASEQRVAMDALTASVTLAQKAAAQKDAEVTALRDTLKDADGKLELAAGNQLQLQTQLAESSATLSKVKADLESTRVYKKWVITALCVVAGGWILQLAIKAFKPI